MWKNNKFYNRVEQGDKEMILKDKGTNAPMESVQGLIAKMKWSVPVDFDLAAIYEMKDGNIGHVAYDNREEMSLSKFPYISLDKDAGIGDSRGAKEETIRIAQIDSSITKIHLVCWDYGAVKHHTNARLEDADLQISIMDDKGNTYDVKFEVGQMGNVCVLATLDNSSPICAKVINKSKVGSFKELSIEEINILANS